VLRLKDKTWTNPASVFNNGFHHALQKHPDIIIIQSPECYHVGDILSFASQITEEDYISFGCFRIDMDTTYNPHNIMELIGDNSCALETGRQTAWWNHPVYNPLGYHWCSAITVNNLIKLNGFDERFSCGYAAEDNYFVHQIDVLGLNIKITEFPFVVHQWHHHDDFPPSLDKMELVKRNLELFYDLSKENNYKAEHILTPNLI